MAQAHPGHAIQADHAKGLPDEHGNSPAAWTGVGIIALGAVVAALGLVLGNLLWFFIAAVAGVVVGCVVWKVMADTARRHSEPVIPVVPSPPGEH